MAYCRFSSDNWKSDLYIWMGFSGVEVVVAHSRYIFNANYPMPSFDPIDEEFDYKAYNELYALAMKHKDTQQIDLPMAGEFFSFDTGEEAAELLTELQQLGYHVPDGVIEELRDEL